MFAHRWSINIYFSAGIAISAAIIALVCGRAAALQDEFSLGTQQAVADYETGDVYVDLLGKLTSMAYWQDGYENITRKWNRRWVDYQFGTYVHSFDIHDVAIFGPGDKPRYLNMGKSTSPISETTLANAEGLKELLSAVHASLSNGPPKAQRGVIVIAGKPFFAVATAVTPEDVSDAPIAPDLQNTVVFFKQASAEPYGALYKGFQAKNVRISMNGNAPPDFTALALRDAAGKARAWLEWQPHRPGAEFLAVLFPVLFIMLFLLAVVQTVAVMHWQGTQKKLIAAQAKAAAAEEANHTKSVFIGNISHELRTPLNAIIGFAEMLKLGIFGPLGSKRYEEYAADILKSGEEMLNLVNDLIEVARIEAGDTATERECIDAAQGALAAIENKRGAAAAKNLTITFEGETNGAWCTGSSLSFRHVLMRLLDNAIRYSKEGDSVTVTLARREAETTISVGDQGGGIPPADLEKIGKLFLGAESHLVTNNSDTGLGLVIVTGLMKLMGGRLSVASELGAGTTMTVHLPSAEAPQAALPAQQQAA